MPSASPIRVSVRPHRSSNRYQSALLRGEARDFQAEHDADVSETDFCGKAREAAAFDSARSGKSEIFVDNRDLLRRPSEFGCAGSKGILTLGRFAVVFDLRGGGRAKINEGAAAYMRGVDLGGGTHRTPPSSVGSPRRLREYPGENPDRRLACFHG